MSLAPKHVLVPVCPEKMGGLESPRAPVELRRNRAVTADGKDLTAFFEEGCNTAMEAVSTLHCQAAVLMQRSPSCGCGQIYDGSFTSKLVEGDGLFTQKLKKEAVPVFSQQDLEMNPKLFDRLEEELWEKRQKNFRNK